MIDCAIIGGGPAGLNAALVLGRARRNVMLLDDNRPRNRVTHESHGFITRDGVKPGEFRKRAAEDIAKYPSVERRQVRVIDVQKADGYFYLVTEQGEELHARKLILATGLKEELPSVQDIHSYYGKSIFSCPYCDRLELRDQPLAVISENAHALHMTKIVYNWSKDVVLCTNGKNLLTEEQRGLLARKGIPVYEGRIASLIGEEGRLQAIEFEDGVRLPRAGGFVTPDWAQAAGFGEVLGCELGPLGGIVTDGFGRTNVPGVYAAGDTSVIAPSQLIIAAGEGSRAAIGVNTDLTHEEFEA